MNFEGEILDKLTKAGIEIGIYKHESQDYDGQIELFEREFAKFPCGRDFIEIRLSDKISKEDYLSSEFQDFKFIKDYEAIWSPKHKIIECEIEPSHRRLTSPHHLNRKIARIFGEELESRDSYSRYSFDESENGINVSIGNASQEYAVLSFLKDRMPRFEFAKRRLTIRIENIEVTRHDKAYNILEKIGNSILFKLDMTANLGFKLGVDRDIRRSYFKRKREEIEFNKSFPSYEYDKEPMSLYWYAKSAIEMPLLQFLALYQILEFYFPIFSQKDAHHEIKNLIKDPRFNPNKDSDITKILNSIKQNKSKLGFGSELEQLKSTLLNCITNQELLEAMESEEEMLKYFKDKKSKKLASKSINFSHENSNLVSDFAERIYEIRCRVVHTKASEKDYNLLLPSSPELKTIRFDIQILETIAKKVLVTGSRLLKI